MQLTYDEYTELTALIIKATGTARELAYRQFHSGAIAIVEAKEADERAFSAVVDYMVKGLEESLEDGSLYHNQDKGMMLGCCGHWVEYPTPARNTKCPGCGSTFTLSKIDD